MTAPYDLDAHVRRTPEREQRPVERRSAVEQLALFDTVEFERLPPVPPRRETGGLVVDDELLFSRAVSLHSTHKAYCARRYADIVGLAMKRWELWWIELFAGPGRLCVRETGEFVPGSPLDVMDIRRQFDGYLFTDVSLPCAESLRRRVGNHSNAHVLCGDANGAEIRDAIAALVPSTALVVLYGDQEGLDLRWDTVKYFIDRYPHLDLLLNLPTTGVVRALAAGYEQKAGAMLGHDDPHQLLETKMPKGVSVRQWYCRRLAAEGFDKLEGTTIYLKGGHRELYDLLLASRHPLARKFFRAAIGLLEGDPLEPAYVELG